MKQRVGEILTKSKMKSERLTLKTLKVKSFVVGLDKNSEETVKGGVTGFQCGNNLSLRFCNSGGQHFCK